MNRRSEKESSELLGTRRNDGKRTPPTLFFLSPRRRGVELEFQDVVYPSGDLPGPSLMRPERPVIISSSPGEEVLSHSAHRLLECRDAIRLRWAEREGVVGWFGLLGGVGELVVAPQREQGDFRASHGEKRETRALGRHRKH